MMALIEPTINLETEFMAMAKDFSLSGDNRYKSDSENFSRYIAQVATNQSGDLPPERVRQSEYWLISENHIIGCTRLRHSLNHLLEQEGGHIGYDICPSERLKGFGILILKLTLEKAKDLGLTHILLTCDEDNIGSVKIIESNGGVLDSKAVSEKRGKLICRYWIELR